MEEAIKAYEALLSKNSKNNDAIQELCNYDYIK